MGCLRPLRLGALGPGPLSKTALVCSRQGAIQIHVYLCLYL